jgi:hypothetical protein
MIFTTDGPRSRHECRWLRIFCKKKCFFVFSLERRSSRREEPGRGSFRILKSQCPCIFAVENNPIPLTFENLSLAQLAVGVGQARRQKRPTIRQKRPTLHNLQLVSGKHVVSVCPVSTLNKFSNISALVYFTVQEHQVDYTLTFENLACEEIRFFEGHKAYLARAVLCAERHGTVSKET